MQGLCRAASAQLPVRACMTHMHPQRTYMPGTTAPLGFPATAPLGFPGPPYNSLRGSLRLVWGGGRFHSPGLATGHQHRKTRGPGSAFKLPVLVLTPDQGV